MLLGSNSSRNCDTLDDPTEGDSLLFNLEVEQLLGIVEAPITAKTTLMNPSFPKQT